jgi:hypothetical protein
MATLTRFLNVGLYKNILINLGNVCRFSLYKPAFTDVKKENINIGNIGKSQINIFYNFLNIQIKI